MEINEEVMAAHKRLFLDFLDQDVCSGLYMNLIREMVQRKEHRLIIAIDDLRNYSLDLACSMIRNPGEYMQPISDALTEVTRTVDLKYMKEGERVLVGFKGPFGFHKVTPRELMSSFIGTMVRVEGIVTKFCRWGVLIAEGATSAGPRTPGSVSRSRGDQEGWENWSAELERMF